jgi:hypothetical protein
MSARPTARRCDERQGLFVRFLLPCLRHHTRKKPSPFHVRYNTTSRLNISTRSIAMVSASLEPTYILRYTKKLLWLRMSTPKCTLRKFLLIFRSLCRKGSPASVPCRSYRVAEGYGNCHLEHSSKTNDKCHINGYVGFRFFVHQYAIGFDQNQIF